MNNHIARVTAHDTRKNLEREKQSISLKDRFSELEGVGEVQDVKFLIDSPEEAGFEEIKSDVERMLKAIALGKTQIGLID